MKIMSIIINRITRKSIVVPSLDKDLLVARHPELIYLFDNKEQIAILSRLWCDRVLTEEQCIELNPAMAKAIEDIRDTWRDVFEGIYM